MLSPKLKEIAEVYALQMIGKEDVEYLLRLNKIYPDHFDDLPQEFHDYVEEYGKKYDAFVKEEEANALAEAFNNLSKKNHERNNHN